MSYQVLARKWRPRQFSEMAGQEHVLRALINALDHDRLHHAYLFTGTRGVGKTSVARILAKCLNCERGVSSTPCGECGACREITDGRFIDLIEVDAASRTKVEDTRELLENVQYAPTAGRFKVYLIDEVHMLSTHSFNALLKTLEEPPPHVKFLFATTDPRKLPVTVLSRCLQFNLKNLSAETIVKQLRFILGEEKIPAEESALWSIARSADGSMRDALSLTDQAISHGGGKITDLEVSAMLGTIDHTTVIEMCQAVAGGDGAQTLALVDRFAELAPDYSAALAAILSIWHRVAIAQTVPEALDISDRDRATILALAQTLSPEDVQLFYQICLLGRRDLAMAADPRSGFEMVMLRMLTFRPAAQEPNPVKPTQSPRTVLKQETKPQQPPVTAVNQTEPVQAPVNGKGDNDWAEMIVAMRIGGMTRELANNCILENIDDKVCTLVLDPGHKQLRSAVTEEKLQNALRRYRGTSLKLVINTEKTVIDTPAVQLIKAREDRQQAAVDAINSDENIQALKEHFDARVLPGTIEPV